MKKIFMTLTLALLANLAGAQYAKILSVLRFNNLTNETRADYGTKSNPIASGAFINIADDKSRGTAMRKLYHSYRWPNGNKIDFSNRFSTGGGSKGVIDCYTLINPETKDTIRLYVDPYKTTEKYDVPAGLVPLTPSLLQPEITPILAQIEEVNQAADGAALKLHAGEILRYLTANFDQNLLIDQDRLRFLLEDKEADKSMVGFLMRSYIFNKYYALAKDIDNESDYAMEKMKNSYESYLKAHPGAVTGKIGEQLKR